MPKIQSTSSAELRVGLNITVNGSKRLTQAEQEALPLPEKVSILIVDAGNPANVLVDTVAGFTMFSSGNVGYKLHAPAQFHETDM